MIFKRKKNVSTRYSNKCEAFLIFLEFHLVTFAIYLVVQNIRLLKFFAQFLYLKYVPWRCLLFKTKHANNSKKSLGCYRTKLVQNAPLCNAVYNLCFKDKLPSHLHVFCTLFLTFIQTSEKKNPLLIN